jgi:hypothetical protein
MYYVLVWKDDCGNATVTVEQIGQEVELSDGTVRVYAVCDTEEALEDFLGRD